MKQIYFFFIILFFFNYTVFAQKYTGQIIEKEIQKTVKNWRKLKLSTREIADSCIRMYWLLENSERQKAYCYAKIGKGIAKENNYLQGEYGITFCIVNYKVRTGKFKDALLLGRKNLKLAKKVGRLEYALSLSLLGEVYMSLSDSKMALECLIESDKIALELGNDWLVANNYYQMAHLSKSYSKYNQAKFLLKKSIEMFEKQNNRYSIVPAYNLIANIFLEEEQVDSVLYYTQKSVKISQSTKSLGNLAQSYNLIANTYILTKEYAQAIKYNTKAIGILEVLNSPNPNLKGDILLTKSEILYLQHSHQQALDILNTNSKLLRRSNNMKIQYNLLLAKIYAAIGNYRKAYAHKEIGDSILLLQKKQTTQKIKENLNLLNQLEEIKEERKLSKLEKAKIIENYFYAILALLTFIILAFIITILYYKKNKMSKVLREQHKYIEKQHKKLQRHNGILQKEHNTAKEYRGFLEKTLLDLFGAHTELKAQSKVIKELNQNLERKVKERTKTLAQRNERLEAYASYNSHVLRAPILRLLGLTTMLFDIQFSEDDKDEILRHIQDSSELLDEITIYMQKVLETEDEQEFKQLIQKEFEWNREFKSKLYSMHF